MKKISIKKATLKDVKFLYNLYNTSIIEKYSKTKNLIKYSDHKNWFLKNNNSKKSKIYILFQSNNKIGYIRFNIFKSKSCFISIYLKKKKRSNNLGSIYLNHLLSLTKNRLNINNIYAEVLKKNTFSKYFFLKNNFKLIKYSNKFKSIFDKKNYIFLRKI